MCAYIGRYSTGLLAPAAHARHHLLQLRVHSSLQVVPNNAVGTRPSSSVFRICSFRPPLLALLARTTMESFPVGLPLSLTLVGEQKLTGAFYAYDPVLSLLLLTSALPPTTSQLATLLPATASPAPGQPRENRNYHLIKSTQITALTVLSPTPDPSLALSPAPALLTPTAVANRIKLALAEQEKSNQFGQLESLPEEMRQIVMALRKTLPVRVQAGVVIVMEEVLIKFPYRVEDVKGNNQERVQRVKLVVSTLTTRTLPSLSSSHDDSSTERGSGDKIESSQRNSRGGSTENRSYFARTD